MSWTLPTMQLLGRIGPVGAYPPNRGNITRLWLFVVLSFFLDPAPRSNRCTDSYAEWLKWRVSTQGRSFWGSGRWVTSYWEYMPQKLPKKWRGVNRQFQAKTPKSIHRNNPELLIRRTSDLRTEFRPWKALRGWSAITPKQIQHGWRPPLWKSIWRHISAVDVPIRQPDAEKHGDYGEMVEIENGSSYISAVNWDMSKFGLLMDFDLLKTVTSTNAKPEVVFSGRSRHLDIWIWRHISSVGASIWTKFGSLMQNNMHITANWTMSKSEVEFQYGGRLYFETGSSYISAAI